MYITPEQDKPIINMFMFFSYWMQPLNQNRGGGERALFFCMYSIEEIVYKHNIFLILTLGASICAQCDCFHIYA